MADREEDYSDNWRDQSRKNNAPMRQSRRQTQRAQNQAQSRAIATQLNSSATETSGGPHRSFVARRFLEDEGDDLEPDHMDLNDDENLNSDMASLGNSNSARGGFFEKGGKYQGGVDQSVNLMDTSAGVYESKRKNKNKKHARPRLGGKSQQATSMVDVFLDYATEGPGQRPHEKKDRSSKVRALLHSTRFWVFLVVVIVVVLVTVFAVTGKKEDKKKSPPSAEWRENHVDLKSRIVGKGISSEAVLKDASTIQHKALKWITEEDQAQMTADNPQVLQRYVMAVLYHGTQPNDGSWKAEDKWMSKHSVCDWHGIDCENILGSDMIVHINLANNNLEGKIPAELKALQYLVQLNLSNNGLHGPIPEEIGHLTYVNFLMLQGNDLSGKLPQSIGNMISAEEIFLSHNKLEGPLPDNIGHLEKLRGLKVDHNLLTGELPSDWKQHKIHSLYLQDNRFKGHIPHQLFQLTTLVDFRLGHNALTGTIPPEIESFHKLEVFDAQTNEFHGEIPEVFDRLNSLRELNLHHNKFDSTLPITLAQCTSIERLFLDENELTGTIPAEWGGMSSLTVLDIKGNKLTGAIPDELGNLKALQTLRLFETSVAGSMPASVCALKLEHLEADCKGGMQCGCCTLCY